ncbi:hypothetical protein V1499_07345 [Neobacillus sp. SCS-31]|uniref:hypothetical protein n=1 Tax=Neobacillus oceani TaxID=3115292 RepID=UPI003905D90B
MAAPLHVVQEWYGNEGKIEAIQLKAKLGSDLGLLEKKVEQVVKNSSDGVFMQPIVIDFETQLQSIYSFFMALYIAGFLRIALSAFIIFNSLYVSIRVFGSKCV